LNIFQNTGGDALLSHVKTSCVVSDLQNVTIFRENFKFGAPQALVVKTEVIRTKLSAS